MKRMVVAGASGVVGSALVDALVRSGEWSVVALSRRPPELEVEPDPARYQHLAVDLRDRSEVARAVGGLGAVSHLAYAALYEKPGLVDGWTAADQMAVNDEMFRNLLDPLAGSGSLEHVTALQGTKAYGAHLHPIPVPARERAPRDDHANFYFLQEDHLRESADRSGFGWTVLRPQLIFGGAIGAAMNLVPVLGAYAAICRETGLPFSFPGGASYVWEAVDARLCADAAVWAAEAPAASGEIFNLTNGDVFEWRHLWPAIADAVGLEPGPDEPRTMASFMPGHAATWDRVVDRHGLRRLGLAEVMGESHHYADLCFNLGDLEEVFPRFVSTVKIRQAGFGGCIDTEETLRHWLDVLARRRVLPPPG
ncbi:SDR family oxidoreductase [Nocardioides abyssi]|uniref:SDR family oxidoreductase n=1 Tax=Nocardioides abyssi TaxID=3058370 RepID=A0ABT8ENX3_9ACTN|nr:SDR family oxidoreductase [Nocardioides abyssi]MDN4159820.1 SDR family oxidoreductase [Nocardioides abyssi]